MSVEPSVDALDMEGVLAFGEKPIEASNLNTLDDGLDMIPSSKM